MTLLSLKDITNCDDYYIDDETLQIYSFKGKNKNGKLMKPQIYKNGYIYYDVYVNGKRKHILYHHIIVKMFINPNYDSTKEEIDHLNHNKQDNRIENLAVVSRSENIRNSSKSAKNGKKFNFVDNIGRSLTINEEAGIYYSLELDKFFMYIEHSGKYKELHECICNGYPCIRYQYNNKQYKFRTTKFRKNLNKQ